jgi:hypothetical protein
VGKSGHNRKKERKRMNEWKKEKKNKESPIAILI